MLGTELNGLLLPQKPAPQGGRYPFRVLERYYGRSRGGGDLAVCYHIWLPAADIQFQPSQFDGREGVVLGVRPFAFDALERRARALGVNDVAVYPAF